MKPSGKYGSLPDSELVAAVRQGDGGAFDTLFLRWYPQVCRFLSALVANPVLAEDLAQQVFIKLWLFRERLDPSKSLKNFIFVLSRNAAMDMFRAERAMDKKGLSAAADSPSQDRTDQLAEFHESLARIEDSINRMPSRRRQIFNMSRNSQLSSKEIADVLDLSSRTVEKHIELALRDIRKNIS